MFPRAVLPLAILLAAAPLAAQELDSPIRGFGGLEFLVASPTGEFAENVAVGFGVAGHGRYAFDERGIISLRGDLGFINYGNETIRICVTQPCRVTGDLTTRNNIVFLGIGPELGLDAGGARLYGTGGVGFAYFGTTSSVRGDGNHEDYASSTNFDDVTFAWMAKTGVQFRIARRQAVPIYLDLGARYHGNGEAEYLRRGDIEDRPDGSVVLNPQRSETNLWTFTLGISLGFPPRGFGGDDRFIR